MARDLRDYLRLVLGFPQRGGVQGGMHAVGCNTAGLFPAVSWRRAFKKIIVMEAYTMSGFERLNRMNNFYGV